MQVTIILPLFKDRVFSYNTTLNNIAVTLNFKWNAYTQHYHMDAKLANGTTVLEGRKLVPSFSIDSSAMASNGLTGAFMLFPSSYSLLDSGTAMYNLSENFALCYFWWT